MRIEYAWLNSRTWFVPVFLLIWDVVAIWVGIAWYDQGSVVVPIICLVLLFVTAYVAMAAFFNTTTLIVRPTELEIEYAPLPWVGDRIVPLETIASLSYRMRGGPQGVGVYYNFYCNTVDKKRYRIVFGPNRGDLERVLKVLLRVIRQAEPYRQIALLDENSGSVVQTKA